MTKPTHLARIVCGTALTAVVLLGTGCASIVHGGSRTVTVTSVPAGAKTTITKADTAQAIAINTTPFTISLDPKRGYFKGQSYKLKFELPGYTPAEVEMHTKLSGWYFGNILLGGLIGMVVVDPITGSMWNLSPDKIEQPLTPTQAALIKEGRGFVVVLASQTTANEKAAMQRLN